MHLVSRAVLAGALVFSPVVAAAQRPNQALTRPDNWGLTFGLEGIFPKYQPLGSQGYAFDTRGRGLNLNIGVTLSRHWMFGAELASVFFGGDQDFEMPGAGSPQVFHAETTNSIVSSGYAGWITNPMRKSPRMGRKWWLGAMLGVSKFSGERRTDGCIPCGSERFSMLAAGYVQPFVVFGGGDKDGGGGFRLGYRHYFKSDKTIRSALTFGLFFDFIKL